MRAWRLPHAFGGALALAWCTQRARGTIDINIFVSPQHSATVIKCLPTGVTRGARDLDAMQRDGQVRLWWERTPIDLFLNTTRFHDEAAQRTRWETFSNRRIPFLSCDDIAVFMAFFGRTKDWADLEEMCAAGTLDVAFVVAVLADHLGAADERIERLKAIAGR